MRARLNPAVAELYLTDERWALIASHLPGKEGDPGCHGRDNRLFIEAVFWIIRNDASWRSLPPQFGKWYTIYTRFRRWTRNGRWPVVLKALAADGGCEFFYENGEIRHVCHIGPGKEPLEEPPREPLEAQSDLARSNHLESAIR